MAEDGVVIEHPNRDKASSKATRSVVIFLLLGSAALIGIVTIGGWDALAGAQVVSLAYVAIYVLMAYYVARWNRGVLPVAAALAIIMLIFAAVAGPGWFDRDAPGYTDPTIPSNVLGLITLIIVPVQALLIAFSMRGVQQAWNVEVERYADGTSNAVPAGA
jgi:hypothetical protein